jgi:broad specificity phosphatase PhoE
MLFRRRFVAALALAGISAAGCGPSCSCEAPAPETGTVIVYVVRHAEKAELAPDAAEHDDPPLNPAGQLRALGLIEDIPVGEITAVYVTATRRSRDTASAVVAVNGVRPTVYPPRDVKGLVERIHARRGQSVLVVGHSNTIPPLLAGLGVSEPITVAEHEYGDLWVVTVTGDRATVERRRYGESIERFDPGR